MLFVRVLLAVNSVLLALDLVHAALDPTEMQNRLTAGAPILGTFNDAGGKLSSWLRSFPDDTAIESINIPGTHDSAAWNHTGIFSDRINTQSLPIFDQLDAGIRFLDIRFGINAGKLMIYHGSALLSDTAELEDVLWGVYHFLDTHPTETIIVSLKVDNGDANDPTLQNTLHNQFTTTPTNDYWVQSETPGVLGDARHKAILFRRYGFLPELAPVGIDVSHDWKDNDGDFVIDYDSTTQKSAFIEDLYQINGDNQPPSAKIPVKFDALTNHIENANGDSNTTQLFVSFASGFGAGTSDTLTPKVLAVGDDTNNVTGINRLMLSWLQQRRGNRFGIIPFDFFDSEPDLVAAAIGPVINTSSGTKVTPGSKPTQYSWAFSPTPISFLAVSLLLLHFF